MKLLIVFEYKEDENPPNFGLCVIDSRKISFSGNLNIRDLEISAYADIFYVQSFEDIQKFKNSGFDINDFKPIYEDCYPNGYIFQDSVIEKILDWAIAKRAWIYVNSRMAGVDKLKFEKFFKALEWQQGE